MGQRLFVGKLPLDCTEAELTEIFSSAGDVERVAIKFDHKTGKQRGFAFVTMGDLEAAQTAIRELHGIPLRGRNIRVVEAESKPAGGKPTGPTASDLARQGPSEESFSWREEGAEGPMVEVSVDYLREITRGRGAVPLTPERIAEITREAAAVQVSQARRRWFMGTLVVALVALAGLITWEILRAGPALDPRAVMITPMRVVGQNEGGGYLGYAFGQALAVNLVAFGDEVRVQPVPAPDELEPGREVAAAREAGAARVVVGSITRSGEAIAVSLTLVDVGDNAVLWGTQAESAAGDVRRLAAALSRELGEALSLERPELYEYVTHMPGTPGMEASPALSAATEGLARGEIREALEPTRQLVDLFDDALAAWVLRAQALMLRWDADPSPGNLAAFRAAVARADELDPNNPYGDFYRAYLRLRGSEYPAALRGFDDVLAREDLTPATRSWILRYRSIAVQAVGRVDEAMNNLRESRRLDPTNPWTYYVYSNALERAGRFEEALTRARQGVALNPTYWRNHEALGLALSRVERFDEAVESLGTACELSRAQLPCSLHVVNLFHSGRTEQAAEAAERARDLTPTVWGQYNLACYAALAGDTDAALQHLEAAVELGMTDPLIADDSDLASLRGHPRFRELVDTVEKRYAAAGEPAREPPRDPVAAP